MSDMGAKADVVIEADLIRAVVTPLANPLEGIAVLLHKKWSPAPDIGGPNSIVISDWNDRHAFGGGTPGFTLVRDSGAPDGVRWSSLSLGKFLLAEAHADLPQGQVFTTGPGLSYSLGSLTLAAGGISNEMLRDSHGQSVIGRAGAAGDPEDIIATFDGTVLRRSGGALAFGALDLADSSTFTGVLPAAKMDPAFPATVPDGSITDVKLRDSIGLSVIGRGGTGTGDPADIAASADGQVLRRSGTTLAFGALDLASSDAVTGSLPTARGGVPAGGTDGQVLTKVSGSPAWAAPTGGGGSGIPPTLIDSKGDLIVGTSPDTAGRLGAGSDEQLLVSDSAQTTGLRWSDELTLANHKGVRGKLVSGASAPIMLQRGTDDNVSVGDDTHALILLGTSTYVGLDLTVGRHLYIGQSSPGSLFITGGDIVLDNNKRLYGKDVGGTGRGLIGIDPADDVVIADSTRPTRILGTLVVDGQTDFADWPVVRASLGYGAKGVGGVNLTLIYINPTTDVIGIGSTEGVYIGGALTLGVPLAMAYGGVPAGGTTSQVLGKASNADRDLSWQTVAGALTNDSVTNAFLRNSAATSVIGRSAATVGDPADIAATVDGHMLRRAAGVLGFGTIDPNATNVLSASVGATKGGTGLTALPPVGAGLRSNGTIYEPSQLWPNPKMTALDQAAWTWVNQGGWTVAQGSGIVTVTQTNVTGENLRGRYKTLTTPSTIIMGLAPTAFIAYDFFGMGIGLRNTAGKLVVFYLISGVSTLALQVRRNSSPTVNVSSTTATGTMKFLSGPVFLKLEWDGSYYQFSHSLDGVNFTIYLAWEDGITGGGIFAGVAPTQVGWFGFNNNNAGVPGGSTIISWIET